MKFCVSKWCVFLCTHSNTFDSMLNHSELFPVLHTSPWYTLCTLASWARVRYGLDACMFACTFPYSSSRICKHKYLIFTGISVYVTAQSLPKRFHDTWIHITLPGTSTSSPTLQPSRHTCTTRPKPCNPVSLVLILSPLWCGLLLLSLLEK